MTKRGSQSVGRREGMLGDPLPRPPENDVAAVRDDSSGSASTDSDVAPSQPEGDKGSRRRTRQINELNRKYEVRTVSTSSEKELGDARGQVARHLGAEIQANVGENRARLDQLVLIRDIEDFWVSPSARYFDLPSERDQRRRRAAKAERRAPRIRRFKIVLAVLGSFAYLAALIWAAVMLSLPDEVLFAGLVIFVLAAVVAVTHKMLPSPSRHPSFDTRVLTTEALMMQRYLDIRDGISATRAWLSDAIGTLDLEQEQVDIAGQLRQMEQLSGSIASLSDTDDHVLASALTRERARLDSIRISMVDRLVSLDRYRASLEQVDIDTERAERFSRVDEISSAMDMLEVGRASSEISINHTDFASKQLDNSIRISRQMLEELRGGR